MRIVGGRHRGRPLRAPGGRDSRPTADRAGEAIFNIRAHGMEDFRLDGASVVDVFAGTGALGLEALSRGAAHATFIDDDGRAMGAVRGNAAALGERGIDAFGPVPPDTLFSPRSRKGYDAAICMYHDQALIPVKAIDFDGAVNVTLGLPFVRTSPDHGTALDIAGSGKANEASLIAALKMAAEIARRRAAADS